MKPETSGFLVFAFIVSLMLVSLLIIGGRQMGWLPTGPTGPPGPGFGRGASAMIFPCGDHTVCCQDGACWLSPIQGACRASDRPR